jgi:hypothetical protein
VARYWLHEAQTKLVFQQNHRGTSNGFRGKFLEGNKSRPLWMLPQALVAKAFFGNLEFDLVVFGPENTEKVGFEAQIDSAGRGQLRMFPQS